MNLTEKYMTKKRQNLVKTIKTSSKIFILKKAVFGAQGVNKSGHRRASRSS